MLHSESSLPQEAVSAMAQAFEKIKPAISEKELYALCEDSPQLIKLVDDLMEYASRYALDVWSMQKFVDEGGRMKETGREEFTVMDEARTLLHTALVDSIAILSRALRKEGKDVKWVQKLMRSNELERSSCGAFALITVYQRYIDNV